MGTNKNTGPYTLFLDSNGILREGTLLQGSRGSSIEQEAEKSIFNSLKTAIFQKLQCNSAKKGKENRRKSLSFIFSGQSKKTTGKFEGYPEYLSEPIPKRSQKINDNQEPKSQPLLGKNGSNGKGTDKVKPKSMEIITQLDLDLSRVQRAGTRSFSGTTMNEYNLQDSSADFDTGKYSGGKGLCEKRFPGSLAATADSRKLPESQRCGKGSFHALSKADKENIPRKLPPHLRRSGDPPKPPRNGQNQLKMGRKSRLSEESSSLGVMDELKVKKFQSTFASCERMLQASQGEKSLPFLKQYIASVIQDIGDEDRKLFLEKLHRIAAEWDLDWP